MPKAQPYRTHPEIEIIRPKSTDNHTRTLIIERIYEYYKPTKIMKKNYTYKPYPKSKPMLLHRKISSQRSWWVW